MPPKLFLKTWNYLYRSFCMVILIRCSSLFSVSLVSRARPLCSHGEPLPALRGPHRGGETLLRQKMVNFKFHPQNRHLSVSSEISHIAWLQLVPPLDGHIAMGFEWLWSLFGLQKIFSNHFYGSLFLSGLQKEIFPRSHWISAGAWSHHKNTCPEVVDALEPVLHSAVMQR